MIILVTYDLKGMSTQYNGLYEYLKGHNGWSHYLASTWLINTDKTPDEIIDDTKQYLQKGDHILAIKFDKPYQGWMPKRAWEWIKRHQE